MRVKIAWPLEPSGNVGVKTTKGRQVVAFAAEAVGEPAADARLAGDFAAGITNVHAGSWLMALVVTVLITASSSTTSAVVRKSSAFTQRRTYRVA